MTTADPRTAPPHPNLLRTVPYSRARAPTTWDPRHAGTTTAAPRRRRAARAPPPSSCATPARAATCARCSGCCTAATSTPTRSVRPAPHRPTPASCAAPPHTCFLCRTAPHLLPMPHRPTPASSASAASLWTLIPPLYLSLACVSDQGDYDKRTATHLAASEGRWAAVRFLLEEGGADANPLDRCGGTVQHVAVLAVPCLGTIRSSDWVRRLGAALCTPERRSSTSDPTEGPCSRNQPALHDTDSHCVWPSKVGRHAARRRDALQARARRQLPAHQGRPLWARDPEPRGGGDEGLGLVSLAVTRL